MFNEIQKNLENKQLKKDANPEIKKQWNRVRHKEIKNKERKSLLATWTLSVFLYSPLSVHLPSSSLQSLVSQPRASYHGFQTLCLFIE